MIMCRNGVLERWSDGVMPGVCTLHTPLLQCSDTPWPSYQLPLLHVEILRDELRAQLFVVEQRKTHAAPLQNFLQLTQLVPKRVTAQMPIYVVQRRHVRVGKQGPNAGRLEHIDQNQMLPANQVQVARETLRKHRVVERGKEDQQRAATQAQSDEGTKLLEIRRDDLRLQRVNRIATGRVMRLPVPGADKLLHSIGEGQQSKQVPLLLRGETENQGGGDETFERGG